MSEDKKELPSVKEMVFNLTDTAKDVFTQALARGVIMAPVEVAKTRWDICFDCEYFLKEPENSIIPYRCKKCGCGMKFKTRVAAAKCPIDKWGPV
jgi:hypothetical protein